MSTFATGHQGLASTLRYALGAEAHIATKAIGPKGMMVFEFVDNPAGRCEEIAEKFFDRGAVVEDAKLLLECNRKIRMTLTRAIDNGGIWEREQ